MAIDFLVGVAVCFLGLMFYLLYFAHTLDECHAPIKWFLRLLSLFMIFPLFIGSHIVINTDATMTDLIDVYSLTFAQYLLYTMLAIFMVYFLYKLLLSMNQQKNDDFNSGLLK